MTLDYDLIEEICQFRHNNNYGNWNDSTRVSGYNSYYYRSDLDSEVYRFFYEIYVKSVTKQNADLKRLTDSNLESINKVLGRDTIRDSKIDWLLNGE